MPWIRRIMSWDVYFVVKALLLQVLLVQNFESVDNLIDPHSFQKELLDSLPAVDAFVLGYGIGPVPIKAQADSCITPDAHVIWQMLLDDLCIFLFAGLVNEVRSCFWIFFKKCDLHGLSTDFLDSFEAAVLFPVNKRLPLS